MNEPKQSLLSWVQSLLVFTPAKAHDVSHHLVRTAFQATLFWLFFLLFVPAILFYCESIILDAMHLARPSFDGQRVLGGAIVFAFGAVNLWSGAVMAVVGEGTPFPLDTAQKLVVKGPFRHVRNPMALGGLGAGVGVGIFFAIPSMVVGVVVVGAIWHIVARPPEERDLEERFGESYRAYHANVPLWLPRVSPYVVDVDSRAADAKKKASNS